MTTNIGISFKNKNISFYRYFYHNQIIIWFTKLFKIL